MSKRKSDSSENPNAELCKYLRELADYHHEVHRNRFVSNAYRNGAAILSSISEKITCGEDAKKFVGIGRGIAIKIDEFLSVGKRHKLDDATDEEDEDAAFNLLRRVSGIGAKKAKQLIDLDIKTLEDLKKNTDKLNKHQNLGLKYFDDFEKKIPRDEIEKYDKIIREAIQEIDENYIVTICGDYRRGNTECNDIDILMTDPDWTSDTITTKKKRRRRSRKPFTPLPLFVKLLEKRNLITDRILNSQTKFVGVCKDPDEKTPTARRIDIRFIDREKYYCALLHYTGSDAFIEEIRRHALKKNFVLGEYTLKPLDKEDMPGKPEVITSEKDIFEKLDLPYKEPVERNV